MNADDLFAKRLLVLCKSADREDRRSHLNLKMEIQTLTSPVHRKELVVRLTDENDLCFMYTLRLGEEDFQSLKAQQGLLVDFAAFPQKFIDLLEMCLKDEYNDQPRFVLHFICHSSLSGVERTTCVLNVVETNPFKHLTHLSLKFIPGSDTDVKKYLADCLKKMTDTNSLLQQKLQYTDTDLNQKLKQTQAVLSSKSIELDTSIVEWTAKMNNLAAKHKEGLTNEREKALLVQSSCQQRYDRERKELEMAHLKIVKQMESRIYEMEGVNKDLTDRRYKSESSIRELKSKLSSIEDEYGRIKQELQSLRKENTSLDIDYHEQEKTTNQLRTRVAVLEQEVKDKEQVLARSSELLDSEQDQKRKNEDELEQRHREIGKLENKVHAMADELKKGNEIIKKLQGEIKNYHAKIKLRTQIATEQEKLLGEKDRELEKLRQELGTTKDSLRQYEGENQKLTVNLEGTLHKLEESKQLLKTNENVIQWLNKQINENQFTQHRMGTFEMSSTASSTGYRPGSGMHNYSTSTYASGSQPQQRPPEGPPTAAHRPYNNTQRQPQVHYNPGLPKKSSLPVSVNRQVAVPPIPEEIRPHGSGNSSPGSTESPASNKENDPPLDPKYFQKREDAIPVRGLMNRSNSPPPIQPPTINPGHNPARISQQGIVAKTGQPSLASAYFPGHGKPS